MVRENLSPEPESGAVAPPELDRNPLFTLPLAPPQAEPSAEEPSFLASYAQPRIILPERIPHLGHLGILIALALFGLLGAGLLTRAALHAHLFGIANAEQAITDIRYTLGSQAVLYLITFAGCLILFPLVWQKGFFAGVQWRGATALRHSKRLISAAFVCFFFALLSGVLMPGPADTPIDKIFRTPGAAWLMFGFGVTLAPFFEEVAFRGFLLPALCTSYDWIIEQTTGQPIRPLDEHGHPQWSFRAMAVASVATSLPFALIHAEQTGYALGPFLLLICVSLVLCWARLSTRALAASVLVHAIYNFLLFSLMLLGTGGFRHLEKM
jgi:hypothetical protein